jgi:hypothetical protein
MAFVLFFVFALLIVALYASRHGVVLPRPRFESFQSGAGALVQRDTEDLPTLAAAEGLLHPRIIQLTTLEGSARYLSLGQDSSRLLTRSDLWELDRALQAIADKAAAEASLPLTERDRYFQMEDGLRVGYHQAGGRQTVFLDLNWRLPGQVYHFDSFVPITGLISLALERMGGDGRKAVLRERTAAAD